MSLIRRKLKLTKDIIIFLFSFESDSFTISSILETLAIGLSDEDSYERVSFLFTKCKSLFDYFLNKSLHFKIKKLLVNGAGAATNTPSFIMNQIETNIKWMNSYEKTICNYLKPSRNLS